MKLLISVFLTLAVQHASANDLGKFLYQKDRFEQEVAQYMVGQKTMVKTMARQVINTFVKKQVSHMLITGPSGTGKSLLPHITKKIIEENSNIKINIKTIDSSQYKSSSSAWLLFNAPRGYVGHDPKGGLLYKALKGHDYSIFIIEDFHHMHRAVQDGLYATFAGSFFDNGFGEVKLKNVLFVFTSNFGTEKDVGKGGPSKSDHALIDDWDRFHLFGVEPRLKSVKTWTRNELKKALFLGLRRSGQLSPQFLAAIGYQDVELTHHFTQKEVHRIQALRLRRIQNFVFKSYSVFVTFSKPAILAARKLSWRRNGDYTFKTGARGALSPIDRSIYPKIISFIFWNQPIDSVIVDHQSSKFVVSKL